MVYKELSQDDMMKCVNFWSRYCRGCKNLDCNNDWDEMIKCINNQAKDRK